MVLKQQQQKPKTKPIFDEDGKIVNPPKRWDGLVEILRGTGRQNEISVEAMMSLGIPYYKLNLHEKQREFYYTGENGDGSRVHLNSIPNRLLQVLCHTTPTKDRHIIFSLLIDKGIIGGGAYPEYPIGDRIAMVAVDANGDLREMPEGLEQAIRNNDNLRSQKSIEAFYAPSQLRKILYHTAPAEERSYYLLSEEERKSSLDIDYPETDWKLRFRLMERFDDKRQLREINDQLFQAILSGEVADEHDLVNFDRGSV
jgi:hypothetical protein